MNKAIRMGWILVLLTMAPLALAEDDAGMADPDEARAAMMQAIESGQGGLNLTEEQMGHVSRILQDSSAKMKAVFQQHGVSRDNPPSNLRQKRKLARDIRPIQKDRDAQLEQVLNDEQMKRLEEIRQQVREELKSRKNA